jgi:beta-mannosidase
MDAVFTGDRTPMYMGGARFYNDIAPRAVRMNCPEIPYWNGCPYGGLHPNGYDTGDHHHWNECTMNPDMEKRITPEEYDRVTAGFISEFGYIGPCRKSSIERYHDRLDIDRNGETWKQHNNTHEKMTVNAGITKHYTDADKLDLDGYLLYAGLCQGLMLGYALESLRYIMSCHGGLTWSFNDCWGEVGWSIVDYYMKRKISWYAVKRAFLPIKLILREEDGIIKAAGINETAEDVSFKLKYGYIGFNGEKEESSETGIILEAHCRKHILEFEKGSHDLLRGCYFAAPVNGTDAGAGVLPAILRSGVFRELEVPAANPVVSDYRTTAGKVKFTVKSNAFAHAVHFNLDDGIRLSDEYFDLLPGEAREIEILDGFVDCVREIRPACILPPG